MSKFLNILAPAGAGAAGVLTLAYVLADQFVVDIPAPLREVVAVQPAQAQEDTVPAEADAPASDEAAVVLAAAGSEPAAGREGGFGLGREALPEEIAAWDIDVRPDGLGLPPGEGDVWTGEEVFVEKCAVCHGDFGEGAGRWPQLAMGFGTLDGEDPVKTVGSYWPYLSTVWDYVHRAMPFGEAQSLTDDEVYALTAYILYLNEIVEDDFVLSDATFAEVTMPNAPNFFMDDRAEVELPAFSQEPCMEACKASVEITKHATVLDVTPEGEDGAQTAAVEVPAAESGDTEATDTEAPDTEATDTETPASQESAEAEAVEVAAAPDPALVEAGERAFRQCSACHEIGADARNRTGPHLNDILGRQMASIEGFRYSNAMAGAGEEGRTWTEDELAAFLADPRGTFRGTKMAFAGLRTQDDVAAVMAYLQAAGSQ